jgi:hypothetical protein
MDQVDGLPSLIGHLKAPFLIGSKLAVDILEQFARCECSLTPSGFVVPQLLALMVDAWRHVVHIKKIPRHAVRMPTKL